MSRPRAPRVGINQTLARVFLAPWLTNLLLVALGAIPGSLLRWLVDDLMAVNLLGAFVLGWLNATAAGRPRAWLLCGGVGFCGSLTSFSGWILELHHRITENGWGVALFWWTLQMLAGLLVCGLGIVLGRWTLMRR